MLRLATSMVSSCTWVSYLYHRTLDPLVILMSYRPSVAYEIVHRPLASVVVVESTGVVVLRARRSTVAPTMATPASVYRKS